MLFKKSAIEMLAEMSDTEDINSAEKEIDIQDAKDVMDSIPEMDVMKAIMIPKVNVETVRINKVRNHYYIELAELLKLAEAECCDCEDCMEKLIDTYSTTTDINKDNFFITIPDTDMEQTIKEATEGDEHALHVLGYSSDLLRNVLNKGLPLRKISD